MREHRATIRRRSGYSAIPNRAMSDSRLSIESRGLLALLMTFREGWVFRASHLMKQCGVGRDKYRKMIGQLREFGYVEITVDQNAATGRFLGQSWVILDEPKFHHAPENPSDGESGPLRDNNYKGDSGSDVVDYGDVIPTSS